MRRCTFSDFLNRFNKCNNTGAGMQYSVHHMAIKFHFIRDFHIKMLRFNDVVMDVVALSFSTLYVAK